MEIAHKLVKAGVINDKYTDFTGKAASSQLGFVVEAILNELGI